MGDPSPIAPPEYKGIIRFSIPDESVPAHERSLFASPASKSVVEHTMPLYDARLDPSLQTGAESLDTHGFTYIKHRSALSESGDPATDWYHGNNVEDIYLPEVARLICSVTGAKQAVVNNVAFRRRLADKQVDPTYFNPRDGDLDKELAKLPKDVPLVYGKQPSLSLEPARIAHIDYTLRGLQNTVTSCRHDILSAYLTSQQQSPTTTHPPRFAAYSLWRPIAPVHRDPLAVCSIQTIHPADLTPSPYRAPSAIDPSGEYMMESAAVLPPATPERQKWYWMPQQREDEVLIVKFADSWEREGLGMGGICGGGGAPHCSPVIPGTEGEGPRVSVEARVLAFW